MNTKRWVPLLALVSSAAVLPDAAGVIIGDFLDTDAPPVLLGGYSMTGQFSVGAGSPVDSFTFAGGREVKLAPQLEVYQVGGGWTSWSHGYQGKALGREVDIWGTGGESILLTLPGNTLAFYLYVEPNFFGTFTFDITATNAGGSLSLAGVPILGESGAAGFGFYTTDPLEPLNTISVTIVDPNAWVSNGFAIGEFGIDQAATGVPDRAATPVLLALAILALAAFRRVWSR